MARDAHSLSAFFAITHHLSCLQYLNDLIIYSFLTLEVLLPPIWYLLGNVPSGVEVCSGLQLNLGRSSPRIQYVTYCIQTALLFRSCTS
jgi:hypothetical protein